MLWVHRLGDQVDCRLVRRKVTLRRAGKAHCSVDNDIAIVIDQVPQLLCWQGTAVLCCGPEHHFVADKDAQLLFELMLRLSEAASYGHQCASKHTFGSNRSHESLDIRGETEGNLLRVVEESLGRVDGRDKLRAPNVTGST